MKFRSLLILLLLLVTMTISAPKANAQEGDITIGEVDIPSWRWGKQLATFTVKNNSDFFRFATVVTEMSFEGTYLSPTRFVRTHFPLIPGEKQTVTTYVNIPGNFGKAKLLFSVYDVIDTLDVLIESAKIFEQPFSLTFRLIDEIMPYFKEIITLPPLVTNSPLFDNEFSHILPFMLKDGKSVEEIAFLTLSDTSFVIDVIDELVNKRYFTRDSNGVRPNYPAISFDEATALKAVAERFADRLATEVTERMPAYDAGIDSLMSAGVLSADTNDFLAGGTVLHHRYPIIAGLLLWGDLGQRFISSKSNQSLMIYARTDPCKAYIPQHMYAVQGGKSLNGHHYYNLLVTASTLEIDYSDLIPEIACPENVYAKRILDERVDWNYLPDFQPESFVFDQKLANELIKKLDKGLMELLVEFGEEYKEVLKAHSRERLTEGHRFWFWNLTVTRTVDKLIERGILSRRGNGHFKFYMRTK